MKICFVHIFRIADQDHLNFLGNILVRTSQVLGKEADIHFVYNGEETSPYLLEKGIKLHPYNGSKARIQTGILDFFVVVWKVRKVCRDERIDIVLNLSDHYLLFPICIGAKLARTRCIARIVGIIPLSSTASLEKMIKKVIGRWAERLSLCLADHVLCLSNSLKKTLVERGNIGEKISVISQGVDLGLFRPRIPDRIRETPARVVFVGRLAKNKGLDDGIAAFLKTKVDYPGLEFVICGHGPEEERLAKTWASREDIVFMGFVPRDKLPEVYLRGDILLLPSRSEGMPNVVIEAMASKVPVVATSTGEVGQLLAQGRGICVPPKDVEGLALALRRMISDDEFRLSCVQKAFDYVTNNHSFEAVRGSTMQLFLKCAGENPEQAVT